MRTKLFTLAIAAIMLSVSFAIGISVTNVTAEPFVVEMGTLSPLPGSFLPEDMAWNDAGTAAVAVGLDMSSGPNAYEYDVATDQWNSISVPSMTQQFEGVCYCPYNDQFWICGDTNGPYSIYYYYAGSGSVQLPGSVPTYHYKDVAVDYMGNILLVGYNLPNMYYITFPGFTVSSVISSGGPSMTAIEFNGVDFNPNDQRFYAVGDFNMGFAAVYTTDPAPLTGGASCYWDNNAEVGANKPPLNEIAWNENYDYGLIVGDNYVYKVTYDQGGSYIFDYEYIVDNSGDYYLDCSWDTDGWAEAAIGGYSFDDYGTYWRLYNTNMVFVEGWQEDMTAYWIYTCAFKPPSSPKWPMLLSTGYSWKANVMANDQSTTCNVNAAFPHIFNLDFWAMANPHPIVGGAGPSLLNTQVDVNATYTFYLEANYSIATVDQWNTAIVDLMAWYDFGLLGNPSIPANGWTGNPIDEDGRTSQFYLTYDASTSIPSMYYPLGAPGEFTIDSSYQWADLVTDHHYVLINVTFGQQTYAAAGDGIWDFPTGPLSDKLFSLNDAESWDFNFTVYDSLNTGARNDSYEEFGVNRAVQITASGNPTRNAPPGSGPDWMFPSSQVTYASNTPYWVNVSLVDDLYLGGAGPGPMIPVNPNIAVMNADPNASPLNSDISVLTILGGPGVINDECVWGTAGVPDPMPTPLNGTYSIGPESNFNQPLGFTQVDWQAAVPIGIPEGLYWTVITFRIEDIP